MPTTRKKPDDSGFVGRLAGRGEEAVTKVIDELAKNPRVTDALGAAMSAKGKVDAGARRTLSQFGLAAADELKDLRKQIERLERRLARLEGTGAGSRATGKRTETKKTPSARRGTTTAKRRTKKAASPSTGRSVGGGSGRGSSPGGGTSS
jgi:polyhydroxyalkanoate synthesis regulator phasin